MMVSTKGRYALRVMIDLAEHQAEGYIPLKAIARRQDISEKYLESIPRRAECRTLPMWRKLNALVQDYLDGVTLADLTAEAQSADHYVI